jgi:hypothetical protein
MVLTQINPKVEFGVNPVHDDGRLRAQSLDLSPMTPGER